MQSLCSFRSRWHADDDNDVVRVAPAALSSGHLPAHSRSKETRELCEEYGHAGVIAVS